MSNEIALDIETMNPKTRDWILAESSRRKIPPHEILKNLADQRAKEHGFIPATGVPLVVASNQKNAK